MSVEAISWALNLASVPRDRGGQPSSACKFVLVGLANHAGPDGTGAFPSVATLVRYTGLSERTVRTCLDRLEEAGVIAPCDPGIVAARIKRADRRPQGWDLNLSQARDDPGQGEPASRTSASQALTTGWLRDVQGDQVNGVQTPHPAPGPVDNCPDEVQNLHPAAPTGCNQDSDGVQPAAPRGAAAAREPYENPSTEPSAARARSGGGPAGDRDPGGGGVVEFFDALGTGWPLTAAQQSRLAPLAGAALSAGWSPAALAGFTGANTSGVRNPYAVLAARLSPGELPSPPSSRGRQRQPPWCGQCNQRTRRREDADGADAGRCPECHRLPNTSQQTADYAT
jgi:hypothetical protein